MSTIYYMWCLCLVTVTLTSGNIVESDVKEYARLFKQTLDSHLEDKLALTKIRDMIRDHEKELGIRELNGTLEFERIFLNIQLRYTDLHQSVSRLKSTIETNLNGPSLPRPSVPGAGPPPLIGRNNVQHDPGSNAPPLLPTVPGSGPFVPGNGGAPQGSGPGHTLSLRRCCVNQRPFSYKGRFRERVALEECYENIDDKLKAIQRTGVVKTMKDNLVRDSGVKWQYFASTTGHYIQYPTKSRLCDSQSPALNSPLTEEWFVEKLRMEKKNLVILVDNGQATRTRVSPDSPESHKDLMTIAIERTLKSLTPDDKVNVILFPVDPDTSGVIPDCTKNLLVATPSNTNLLVQFVNSTPSSDLEPSLLDGITTVYSLLEQEQIESEASFERPSNLVIILIDGKSLPTDLTGTSLFQTMARYQQKLGNSIQHLVYILGEPDSDELTLRMGQIADQNNLKILQTDGTPITKWPAIPELVSDGQSVGKEGLLNVVKDIQTFPEIVSTYFQILPPKLDNSNGVTTLTPILDNVLGIKMTLTALVYNISEVLGVVAVDASIGSVFTEIANFDVGQDSYMFLLELRNGKVLMHPKLRDPDQTLFDDTVFPGLDLIEPDLTVHERRMLLNGSTSVRSFTTAQLKRARSSVSGEVSRSILGTPIPATVYFRRVSGTHLCVVLVHFSSDNEEARLLITTGGQIDQLHAPYHRIDQTVKAPFPNKPDQAVVCHLNDNFVSFQESVIKLSPSVFADPEAYKYKVESINDISQINSFLINGGNTSLLREDAKALIQQTVRATNGLDILWQQTAKEVIDRFYGSTSGVFRLFPGSPLQNGFDHLKSDWYQRSIANTNTTFFHYGKLTGVTRNNVVIVSQAVTENGRIQGVAGLTVTSRYFTSQLLNTIAGCQGQELRCHVIDASGYILVDSHQTQSRKLHLADQYPWLVKDLISRQGVEVDWCTGFSDGYHKLIYTLVNTLILDSTNPDTCRQYRLEPVTDTNVFLLLLTDQHKPSCLRDMQTCASCDVSSFSPRYRFSLSQCQTCTTNTIRCQCPCYCTTDYDTCHGQFKPKGDHFPTESCFNRPIVESNRELQPDSPGPMFEHCSIPCAAIEDLVICHNLTHCKLSSDAYPVCVWKDEDELKNVTESKFLPTTPIPKPPPIHSTLAPGPSTRAPGPSTPAPGSSTRPPGPPTIATMSSTDLPPFTPPGEASIPPSMPSVTASFSSSRPVTLTKIPSSSTVSIQSPIAASTTPLLVPPVSSTKFAPIASMSTKSSVPSTKLSTTLVRLTSISPRHTERSTPAESISISPAGPVSAPAVDSPSPPAVNPLPTGNPGMTGITDPGPNNAYSTIHPVQVSTDGFVSTTGDDEEGLDGGQIAAIIIGGIAVIVIIGILLIKLYGKKFRRPGAADSSKYLAGSGVFNSSFFNRSTDEVTLSAGPRSSVMYTEMTN